MEKDKIIYQLTVADIQTVTDERLGRELTEDELKNIVDRLGDYINWFDAIEYTLNDLNLTASGE